jgi:anti-sigma factor RsiW
MSCANKDQDILLLVHGELPLLRRLILQAHLSQCRVCKRRMDEFTAASHHIAAAVRDPRMQAWTIGTAPSVMAAARQLALAKALLITGAIVIAAGLAIVRFAALSNPPRKPAYTTPHQAVPCVPGLNSDRCH